MKNPLVSLNFWPIIRAGYFLGVNVGSFGGGTLISPDVDILGYPNWMTCDDSKAISKLLKRSWTRRGKNTVTFHCMGNGYDLPTN